MSVETILTLFALKIAMPKALYITRGNHETLGCGRGSFEFECADKMSAEFFHSSHYTFSSLPLAYVIQKKFFVSSDCIVNRYISLLGMPRWVAF